MILPSTGIIVDLIREVMSTMRIKT